MSDRDAVNGSSLPGSAECQQQEEEVEAAAAAGARAGRDLKEWLREQFCDSPIEGSEDTRLHDATYVGDLDTIASLLREDNFR
eukprot:g48163.t1